MDRVKKMVHYWCDDIKKAGLTRKRGDGCRFWIPDLRRSQVLERVVGGGLYI